MLTDYAFRLSEVGEVVLLEGWMGDRLKELFPRSPAMVNEWAGHIQVVPPHYLEGEPAGSIPW